MNGGQCVGEMTKREHFSKATKDRKLESHDHQYPEGTRRIGKEEVLNDKGCILKTVHKLRT